MFWRGRERARERAREGERERDRERERERVYLGETESVFGERESKSGGGYIQERKKVSMCLRERASASACVWEKE